MPRRSATPKTTRLRMCKGSVHTPKSLNLTGVVMETLMFEIGTAHRYVEPMLGGRPGSLLRSCVPYDDRVVGTRGAAAVLGVSVSTLARLRKRGGSPAFSRDWRGHYCYSMSDLIEWDQQRGHDTVRRSHLS